VTTQTASHNVQASKAYSIVAGTHSSHLGTAQGDRTRQRSSRPLIAAPECGLCPLQERYGVARPTAPARPARSNSSWCYQRVLFTQRQPCSERWCDVDIGRYCGMRSKVRATNPCLIRNLEIQAASSSPSRQQGPDICSFHYGECSAQT
jgi:hypothetical protein